MMFLFGQHSKNPANINFFYNPHAELKLLKAYILEIHIYANRKICKRMISEEHVAHTS